MGGNQRDGFYRIRLHWNRISKELKLGKPMNAIHADLLEENLYPFSYSNFIKSLRKVKKSVVNENNSSSILQEKTNQEKPNKNEKNFVVAKKQLNRDIKAEEVQKEKEIKKIDNEFFPED